jgi:hypothetical protein
MAQSKIQTSGFSHDTWTRDRYVMVVFVTTKPQRRYHRDTLVNGTVERSGLLCIIWDVAEAGAESAAPVSAGIRSQTLTHSRSACESRQASGGTEVSSIYRDRTAAS